LSKKAKDSQSDSFKQKVENFSKLSDKKIDEYIDIVKYLMNNNETAFVLPGALRIKKGVIAKYNAKYSENEDEISEMISNMFLFTYIDVKASNVYPEVKTNKNILSLIRKLNEQGLYKTICTRFFVDRNLFINADYQYLIREFPNEEKKLTLNTCEVHLNYIDLSNDMEEIVIEFDKIHLNFIINLLQNALNEFKD